MIGDLPPLVLASVGVLSMAAGLADTTPPSEADFFSAQPVVLTASRLAQPLSEAPAAITVIDREMIEASGFVEIADLLRLVPGFQVGLSTSHHSIATTYHGQSDALPRRLEVLVDGRSAYSSVLNMEWHDLGIVLDDVERIEVVRGPSSPVYGSNAFVATINIVTRDRHATPGWYARATTGSDSIRSALLRHGGSMGDLDYRVSLGYEQSDGFAHRNDENRLRSLNLRGWHDLGSKDTFEFQLGFQNGSIGRGGDDRMFNPLGPNLGRNPVENHLQQLRWNRIVGSGRDTSVQFYHQRRSARDDATAGRLADILPPELVHGLFPGRGNDIVASGLFDYTDERYDLEWQYNDAANGYLPWMVGAGLRMDRLRSQRLIGRDDFVQDRSGRLFANAAYRVDRWTLNAGGMLEHGDLMDHAFSYRLGINRQMTPAHTLRANVTRSLRRNGLLGEYAAIGLYFEDGTPIDVILHGTPGALEPEEMLAWEIGWLGDWPERGLSLDAKAFREMIRREIRSVPGLAPNDPLPGAFLMANVGGVNLTGVEGQLRYRPYPGTLAALQFSLVQAVDRYDPASSGLASVEGRTPYKTISLLLSHSFDNDLQVSAGYYHVDAMRWEGPGEVAAGKPPVPAYDRVDLRLAKRFRPPAQEILLELIAQNVGGSYTEFRADNRFGTRYFLRASIGAR